MISDLNTIQNKILEMNLSYLPIIVILAPISWFIIYLRWHLLLRNSNISIPFNDNFKIFLSGYAMSATPGKIGEIIKSQLLHSKYNIPKKQSLPIIISEQFYNLIGILFISMLGLYYFDFSLYVLLSVGTVTGLIYVLLNSQKFLQKAINIFSKIKFLQKYTEGMTDSHLTLKKSINGKIFFISSLLSIIFWLIESLIVYLVLHSFGIFSLEFLELSATYTTSIIIGVASFLPMGIGVVEGSLAGFFSFHGIELSLALTLVIFIRIFTRWYGVAIGLISMKLVGAFSLKQISDKN
jgi:glycosyltransferase 2 family protein